MFEAAATAEPITETIDKEEYSKVMKVLKRFWDTSKEVMHLDKLVRFVGEKIEQGVPLVEWMNDKALMLTDLSR